MSVEDSATTRLPHRPGGAALVAGLSLAALIAAAPALASPRALARPRTRALTQDAGQRPSELRALLARRERKSRAASSRRTRRTRRERLLSAGGPRSLLLSQEIEVETLEVRSTSTTAALVEGAVFDAPKETTVQLYYAEASSEWCESEGVSGARSETATQQLEGEEAQLKLGGLEQGVAYCVALAAHGGGSSGMGEQLAFVAGAPSVGESFAVSLAATSVQISATVDAAGQPAKYRVLYGVSESEWCRGEGKPEDESEGTLSAEAASAEYLEVLVGGLKAGSEYCALLQLENETRTATGEEIEFTAGAPTVLAPEASPYSPTEEIFEGYVAPAGQAASYYVEYAPAETSWCETEEATEGWPRKSGVSTLAPGAELQPALVEVAGLQAGTTYCAALVAENEATKITQEPVASLPPVYFTAGVGKATELQAVPVSPTKATLYATLYEAGQPTDYTPVYAEAQSPTCSGEGDGPSLVVRGLTPLGGEPFASGGGAPPRKGFELDGLTRGQTYCAYLVASNESGTTDAEEARESETYFVAGAPTASTNPLVKSTQTTALLAGEVEPAGQSTSYLLLYGPASSRWCQTEGEGTAPNETAAQTLAAGGSFVAVQLELRGLSARTEYCAAFVAENETGASEEVSPVYFQTPPPAATAVTSRVSDTTQTTATVEGEVDPGYAPTSYWVQYGLASSQWCQTQGAEGLPEGTTSQQMLEAEDGEAHAVQVELTALSAGSEYCAALVAENETGEPSTPTPLRFTTASSESAGPQGGQNGGEGQGVLGSKEEGGQSPQLGTQAQAGTVSGTVTVQLKGTKRFVALGAGALIPDGSEIEATHGRVRVGVSLPNGTTQTAEVFGGRFRIEQEKSGFTKFVLTLALTGCPRTKLPPGSASAASIVRTQPLKKRHLWVTEKGGKWGTNGRYVSTSVEGTTWNTTDECGRSIVFVKEGRVKVRNLVTHRTKVLTAGHSYVAHDSSARARKHHRV